MKLLFVTSLLVAIGFVSPAHAETPVVSGAPTLPTTTGGTNNTSKSAGGSAGIAQMASIAAGAAAMTQCVSSPPKPIFCAIAAANLAAASMMGGGQDNAGNVEQTTAAGGTTGTQPGAGYDTGGGGGFSPEAQALTDQLANAGYSVSPDGQTLSLPSGQSVPFSQLGSTPGYETTPEVKEQMAKIEAEVSAKFSGPRVVGVGTVDGGGGGGMGPAGGDSNIGSRFSMNAYLKGLRNRDPSSVSGLSKKLGEDNIGIKSDNIFEMVSRQYKRKQSQSAFLAK